VTTPFKVSERGLIKLAAAFAGQEDVGIAGGMLLRLARFLQGDPSLFVQVTSTGTGNSVGLPDHIPAMTFVGTVQGNPVAYRTDGSPANAATDQVAQPGAVITLTGRETMRAFQFCSTAAANAVITGQYFD
jgi:hypothetical protein